MELSPDGFTGGDARGFSCVLGSLQTFKILGFFK